MPVINKAKRPVYKREAVCMNIKRKQARAWLNNASKTEFENFIEEAMFNRFYEFLHSVSYPKLSGVIYVNTPVEECIKRIKGRGRKEEKEIPKEYLAQLNDAFLKVINESGVPLLMLDGLYDLQNDIESVGKQLTDFISSKINGPTK